MTVFWPFQFIFWSFLAKFRVFFCQISGIECAGIVERVDLLDASLEVPVDEEQRHAAVTGGA